MNVNLEDFKTGWFQVSIGVRKNEIPILIKLLTALQEDEHHFHLINNYEAENGIENIEFYIQEEQESDNMLISGPAISPNR